jgi:hypothetical protein
MGDIGSGRTGTLGVVTRGGWGHEQGDQKGFWGGFSF